MQPPIFLKFETYMVAINVLKIMSIYFVKCRIHLILVQCFCLYFSTSPDLPL